MKHFRLWLILLAITPTIYAQSSWQYSAGVAAIYAPSYLGDDAYQLGVYPSVSIRYGDSFFAGLPQGIGYNFRPAQGWRVGPLAQVHFGRDETGDSPFAIVGPQTNDLHGLSDIDPTLQLGAFAEYTLDQWQIYTQLLQGIGGYSDWTGETRLTYSGRWQGTSYSFGPRIQYGGTDFHQVFFGITPQQSTASSLATYTPQGGIYSYGLCLTLNRPISQHINLTLLAGYDYLGSQAADSPLIRQYGSRHQLSLGSVLGYRF